MNQRHYAGFGPGIAGRFPGQRGQPPVQRAQPRQPGPESCPRGSSADNKWPSTPQDKAKNATRGQAAGAEWPAVVPVHLRVPAGYDQVATECSGELRCGCALCRHARTMSGKLYPAWARCFPECRLCLGTSAPILARVLTAGRHWDGQTWKYDAEGNDGQRQTGDGKREYMNVSGTDVASSDFEFDEDKKKPSTAAKRRARKRRVKARWAQKALDGSTSTV
jgi:hypothetical protein